LRVVGILNWNADIDLAQQRIQSKISEITNALPAGVNIIVERMNPSILAVMGYSLESHNRTPIEMKMLAMYTIKPYLSRVPGVSEVRVIGGKTKEYDVLLDQQKMNALSITPAIVSAAIAQNNIMQSNGYLNDYRQMYLTITDASVNSLEQLRNIVVSNNNKRITLLKDIADISINDAKEYIKINANGHEVYCLLSSNNPIPTSLSLSTQMQKQVAELQKILPKDVFIKPYYIQADFVNDAIRSVTDSLWVGLVLAIIVAVLFLRSFKASSVILITIPVTLLLTIIVLYATGQTLNIMTLGAIAAAIGLIIDDAIVVVEQIHRTHEEHPEESSLALVQKAIKYLFPAMVSSSLSTIVIFLPFELMSGVAGAYFKVLTNTMLITLICSFFVTWLALPVIYLLFSKDKKRTSDVSHLTSHVTKNQRWVSFFIRHSYISFAIVAALIVAIILIYPNLQTGFLPEMDEGSIVLDYVSPPGTSLAETDRILQAVEKEIVKVPEVQAYSRRTGTQMGFFITEPNTGDYLIELKRDRDRSTEDVIADIRQRVENTQPALRIDFGQVIGDMLGDLMTSVQPIEVKIFGNDENTLHELSKQVASIVENVEGTADVFDGITITGPSINIVPNYVNLAQYGITTPDFQSQLQTALEGNVAGSVYDKNQQTDVRVMYPGDRSRSLDEMKQMQLFLPGGQLKSIASLADVQLNAGEAEIQREDLQNMGVVEARLDNRDLGSAIKEIQQQVSKTVSLPQGYSIEYGGAYAGTATIVS
jgi:Cu/Ag efflux pump CusA